MVPLLVAYAVCFLGTADRWGFSEEHPLARRQELKSGAGIPAEAFSFPGKGERGILALTHFPSLLTHCSAPSRSFCPGPKTLIL